MRLPSRPLLAILERAAIRQGYLGTRPAADGQSETGYPGLRAFCKVLGFDATLAYRAEAEGAISLSTADRIAVALGLHPLLVWPGEYNAWLDEAPAELLPPTSPEYPCGHPRTDENTYSNGRTTEGQPRTGRCKACSDDYKRERRMTA